MDVHPVYQAGASFPGVEYAWVKMTDGGRRYSRTVGNVVYTADEHARRLRDARIPFGGYDYAQPGDGAAAARGLLAECNRLGGLGVTPATDIEDDPKIHTWSTREAVDFGRAFCAETRRQGIRPAVYMNASKMQACRPDLWPEDPVIWVARFGNKPEAGGMYQGRYEVHQYTSSGSLPGSAGLVDWNQSYSNAHLYPQEDDMQLTDTLATWNGSRITVENALAGAIGHAEYIEGRMAANQAALMAAIAALSNDPDMTVDKMREIVDDAVKQHVETKVGPVR
ncbi:GH25 family lysozyme [Amycolatopsis sp. lyj-112]|uniref:GH25 family lysozyme n=1 Tax=Amycolatopsis sp. lyj-112 TaxID=2789288 RepID=UPI00397A2CFD